MRNEAIMSLKEARQLLGLPARGSLVKTKVESAFNHLVRQHQAKLNSALTREERERDAKILILLQQAKHICLGLSKACASSQAGQTVTPNTINWNNVPHAAVPSGQAYNGGMDDLRDGAKKFGNIFVHLWLSVKSLFEFIVAIPDMVGGLRDIIADTIDRARSAGIPKFVIVIVLILGVLPFTNSFVHLLQKITEWLHGK